jgi:hypothetical protein
MYTIVDARFFQEPDQLTILVSANQRRQGLTPPLYHVSLPAIGNLVDQLGETLASLGNADSPAHIYLPTENNTNCTYCTVRIVPQPGTLVNPA